MIRRPSAIYRDGAPGRHIMVYSGRSLKGFVVIRDGESHTYAPEGDFVGTFVGASEGLKAAREWLLSDQGGRQC
ncbi:hypothetical protein GCM10007874_17770 [Labrys miyagiensis]|uniref:Uncharacterized protein n=1 Tax=Labrys miyagiensis TaxID=346912 RepID=A0ABQ6CIR6_9HYPH|nr:hypothetical protein [Labrys miyagiensis]GLS18760.1 hypothetical protein GCM10007874_17770 [Labrys miyagiensis]